MIPVPGRLIQMKVPPRSVTCRRRAHHLHRGDEMAKRTCMVEGCEREHHARGLCKTHERRLSKTGTTDQRPRPVAADGEAKCSADGCDAPVAWRSLCKPHYNRALDTGAIERIIPSTIAERLWSKFVRDENGCWIWTGSIQPGGYGHMWAGGNRYGLAHRVMYELIVGEVPAGLELDHLCRVRSCVNPAHLEPVTRSVNTRRGLQGALKTHCRHGHPWVEENILTSPDGRRVCKLCVYARNAEYKRRTRAES